MSGRYERALVFYSLDSESRFSRDNVAFTRLRQGRPAEAAGVYREMLRRHDGEGAAFELRSTSSGLLRSTSTGRAAPPGPGWVIGAQGAKP